MKNFGTHFKQKKTMIDYINLSSYVNFFQYIFIKIVVFTCTKK